MYRLLFLVLLGACLQLPAIAQKNLLPAEIVLTDGRIQQGYVRAKDWPSTAERFVFKDTRSADVAYYHIDSIAEINIGLETDEQQRYLVHRGSTVDYSQARKEVFDRKEGYVKYDTLLLRIVLQGTVSLYHYDPKDGPERYFVEKNGSREELVTYRYQENGFGPVIRQQAYREQLNRLLSDCPGLEQWISVVKTRKLDLEQLMLEYNDCGEGQSLVYSERPVRAALILSPVAGVAFTRVSRQLDQIINLGSGEWRPQLGVRARLSGRKHPDTRAFLGELLFAPIGTDDREAEIRVDVNYLQGNLLYQSSWPSGQSWPYAMIGLGYQVRLGQGTEEGLPLRVLPQRMLSGLAGMGFRRGRFHFDVRYEIDNLGLLFRTAPPYYAHSLGVCVGVELVR